jgi:hypothetical protein
VPDAGLPHIDLPGDPSGKTEGVATDTDVGQLGSTVFDSRVQYAE